MFTKCPLKSGKGAGAWEGHMKQDKGITGLLVSQVSHHRVPSSILGSGKPKWSASWLRNPLTLACCSSGSNRASVPCKSNQAWGSAGTLGT